MQKVLAIAFSLLVLTASAFAQKPVSPPRPTPAPQPNQPPPAAVPCAPIRISATDPTAKPGDTIRYSARVDNPTGAYMLQYKWTISPTAVFAGQGGPEIEFERPPQDGLNLMLEVTGLPAHCPRHASQAARFNPTPRPMVVEQYMGLRSNVTEQRIKRIADMLRNQPTSQLFIVLEFGSEATQEAAKEKGKTIAGFLTKHTVDDKRVSYALGKGETDRVRIWLIPAGADFPKLGN